MMITRMLNVDNQSNKLTYLKKCFIGETEVDKI